MNKVEPIIPEVDVHNYLASEQMLIYWLNIGIELRNNIVDSASIWKNGKGTGEILDEEDYESILELDKNINITLVYLNTQCLTG